MFEVVHHAQLQYILLSTFIAILISKYKRIKVERIVFYFI